MDSRRYEWGYGGYCSLTEPPRFMKVPEYTPGIDIWDLRNSCTGKS